ncbi:MAG TPA: Uma2 family endonuclease [Terriglobia bacterium]|nr:Uma2 family endonuclease [Terriglobia bacterium]
MATKTLLTVEEFARIFERRDCFYELVEGELITVSPGMFLHNFVRDNVLLLLKTFVEAHRLGVVVSEQPFHLFGNTVRYPDVAFVRSGRLLPAHKFPEGAPDLAVEIISPSNTPREMHRRISDFFAAGSTRVWVVYPEVREVYVHGLTGVVRRSGDEALEDSELLPGFSVKVSNLFGQAES